MLFWFNILFFTSPSFGISGFGIDSCPVTFVDETQGSMRARSATLQTSTPTSSFGQLGSPVSTFSERHTNPDSPVFSHDDSPQVSLPDLPLAKGQGDNDGATVSTYSESTHMLPDREDASPLSPIYLELPVWPLTDPSEALLLRHFVQNLAIWVSIPSLELHSLCLMCSCL